MMMRLNLLVLLNLFLFYGNTLAEEGDISLSDHKALVFNLEGMGQILKNGSETWEELHPQTWVEAGDRIRTGENALVEIAYDALYLNVLRLDAQTFAEFRSIEPTDVYLTDGAIFSRLEGLASDSLDYTISTATAVVGVRGTSFLRDFDAQAGLDYTGVLEGIVHLAPLGQAGTADWNRKIEIQAGHALQFETKELEPQDFEGFQPQPLSAEQKARLEQLSQSLGQRIENKQMTQAAADAVDGRQLVPDRGAIGGSGQSGLLGVGLGPVRSDEEKKSASEDSDSKNQP